MLKTKPYKFCITDCAENPLVIDGLSIQLVRKYCVNVAFCDDAMRLNIGVFYGDLGQIDGINRYLKFRQSWSMGINPT